jgi:hypothetical protein
MPNDPTEPLLALLDNPALRSDISWQSAAADACGDCIARIDQFIDSTTDSDVHACLEAVRNSLNWAMTEAASVNEVQTTISRALTAISRVAETV